VKQFVQLFGSHNLPEGGLTMVTRTSVLGALLSILILPVHASAAAAAVVSSSAASQEIVIKT
jgi:hypothetical protein